MRRCAALLSNRPRKACEAAAKQAARRTCRCAISACGCAYERAKRGMTRKMLAEQCQTSERYLAQIETRRGQIRACWCSIRSRACSISIRIETDAAPARAPVRDALSVAQALSRAAARIALVGLRGAGKSTLGAVLAERLRCAFVELDKMIEREHGAPVATLFEVYGQGTFRRYERDCLTRVVATESAAVIATAGGIVADETTLAQLLDQTHVIWLQASPAEHMRRVMEQGDFRPMAHNRDAMNDLVAILDARAADYGRAHARSIHRARAPRRASTSW